MGERARKYNGGGLHCFKHNVCTGIISRQKFHWTMNKNLNNEGQEWKTEMTNVDL
jgi:hypothetical protein